MPRKKKPTLVSVFTGAGGLDLGLEVAGFDVRLCIENDAGCLETLKNKRPRWQRADPGDVLDLTPPQALRQSGLKRRELTLLSAGPPCQPFSKSSFWANGYGTRMKDDRAQTITPLMNLVEAFLPRVLLIENVTGIVYRKMDEAFQLICDRLHEINSANGTSYKPSVLKLNAVDYGVSQRRERVFVICDRDGRQLHTPQQTHGPGALHTGNGDGPLTPYRTAWDAIGHLSTERSPDDLSPRGYWGDLLKSIPEGHNYLWHTPRNKGKDNAELLFGWRTKYWSFLLKLAKNKPSWTLQASPGPATGPFHWSNRMLTRDEMCCLQTFPEGYVDHCVSYRSAVRQIGNAVPPAMGELLGYEIRSQLLGLRAPKLLSLIPGHRDDCPRRSPTRPVDPRYYKHHGDHPDHPGKHRGPRAVAQGRSPD